MCGLPGRHCVRRGAALFAKPEHSPQDTKVGYAHNPKGAYLIGSLLLFSGRDLSGAGDVSQLCQNRSTRGYHLM